MFDFYTKGIEVARLFIVAPDILKKSKNENALN